jgi:rfaE bifunctional protein kinase chain/domain
MTLHATSISAIEHIHETYGSDAGVVFVSGIFNTIHPGHSRLFRYACQQGAPVVIGILDEAIGEKAILSAEDRLAAVSDNSYVDYAFILHDRPEDFISEFKPRTVLKGKEHSERFNPERAVVEKYGGRLIFSSGETSFSSLELLRQDFLQVNHATIVQPTAYLKRHNLSADRLAARISEMRKRRIIVIGDTIVDEYATCDAVGLSREDPTVVVRPLFSKHFLGGAGIVAAHARALGAHVDFFTVLGKDSVADLALSMLNEYKVTTHAVVDETRPSTHKKRYRAHDRTMLRVNTFSEVEISSKIQQDLFERLMAVLDQVDLLIFSDFNYGILPQSLVEKIAIEARERNIFLLADSQTSSQTGDISRYHTMSLMTPTEHEARVALRDTTSGLAQVAKKLMEIAECENLVVTLGAEGVFGQTRHSDGEGWISDRLSALNKAARDPAGAGDAMLVAMGLAMTSGASLWEALYLGAVAAACQVSRIGNMPLSPEEILREVVNGK